MELSCSSERLGYFYASAAREDHNISFARLIALSHALARLDLLDLGARSFLADLRRTDMVNAAATWLEGRLAWCTVRCHQLATQHGIAVCGFARVLLLGGIIAATVVLARCTSWLDPQQGSGQSHAVVKFSDTGKPTLLEITDGKERGSVALSGKIGEKLKFSYAASDVRAFDGQALRARLEEVVAREVGESWREIAPGVVDALTRAAIDVFAPGASPLLQSPLP